MPSVYYQAFQEFATFLLGYKRVLQNPQFSINATIAHKLLLRGLWSVRTWSDNSRQQHLFGFLVFQVVLVFVMNMII